MDRTPRLPWLRCACVGAPGLLLGYAGARWLDGRDGTHGPGSAWDVGHLAFLAAMACFGVVVVGLNRTFARARRAPRAAAVSGAAGLAGVALFGWVILGDLLPAIKRVYELPDPVMALGPLLFLAGLAVPLAALGWARPQLVPAISPVVVALAFVLLAADLDFLVVAAALFGVALWSVPEADAESRRPTVAPESDGIGRPG